MNYLVVIPARGGSKGIPYKNIKELGGKPLITYSIDIARQITTDDNICISSDDSDIIHIVEDYGLHVPFKRPAELATDDIGTNEVLLHALNYYESRGQNYDIIILLQPTSPFRKKEHIIEALELYNPSLDMIVSVKEASSNPYYNIFEEKTDGYLYISKGDGSIQRRQEAPKVWEYNGSIYIINAINLKNKGLNGLTHIKKFVMNDFYSVDLDTPFDWLMAELLLKENM